MDFVHPAHGWAAVESHKKSFQSTFWAFGNHLHISAAQVPANANQLQAACMIHHKVAEPHSLDTALYDGFKPLFLSFGCPCFWINAHCCSNLLDPFDPFDPHQVTICAENRPAEAAIPAAPAG